MKKAFIFLAVLSLTSFQKPPKAEAPPAPEEAALASVEWLTFEQALERSKKEPKKIFIDVYTDWCGWCKKMDKNTFSHQVVAELLNEHYYAVKLDAEQTEPIEFSGQTFKFVPSGRKGYHELAAALLQGKLSFPTVVFLDEDFKMIQPIPGYQTPENLAPILEYIGEEHYSKTPWEEFAKGYKFPSGK